MRTDISQKRGLEVAPTSLTSAPEVVEQRLQDNQVRVAQLGPEQRAAYRAYASKITGDIESVTSRAPEPPGRGWTEADVKRALGFVGGGKFDKLSARQKAQFIELLNAYPTEGTRIPREIRELFNNGKLFQKDFKGTTMLDSLAKLSNQELGEGLNRQQVLQELVERINKPEKISQRNRGTCTVTSLEYVLASKHPAEFARIISGLMSEEGSVELADGSDLDRDGGCLHEDGSNRASIDRVFQASLMEYSNGMLTNYDNADDQNERLGIFDKGSGLAAGDLDDGMDAVLGRDYQVERYDDKSRAGTIKRLQRAVNDGHQVLIAMRWSTDPEGKHGYHQLALTGVTSGSVQLWNPWGDGEQGQADGPPRRLNSRKGAGHITMTHNDFFSRMTTLHLPPGY